MQVREAQLILRFFMDRGLSTLNLWVNSPPVNREGVPASRSNITIRISREMGQHFEDFVLLLASFNFLNFCLYTIRYDGCLRLDNGAVDTIIYQRKKLSLISSGYKRHIETCTYLWRLAKQWHVYESYIYRPGPCTLFFFSCFSFSFASFLIRRNVSSSRKCKRLASARWNPVKFLSITSIRHIRE